MRSSRVTRSGAILSAVVALFLLGSVGTGYAQLNLVYVETNDGVKNANSVAAYSNDGSGNLTPLAGSPYLTGGTGVGGNGAGKDGALDADQEVIINSAGTLLLAVNGHSNSVASFTINSDGTLTTVAGSPFTASGRDPVSLGLFENYLPGGVSLLTVVDKDGDPNQSGGTPRYVNYKMTSGGALTVMAGTAVAMPAGSNLSQALTDKALGLEFTDEFMATPSTITARKVAANGRMTTVSSVPSPDGLLLLGEVKHPTQNIIYVAMPGSNGMAVLTFDSAGNLTLANTVANAGNTICWFDTNAAGTYLYSGNAGDGTVSVFDISNPTSPVETQYFKLSGNARTANVRVDPTGQFLYAMDVTHLHVLNISAVDGTLSETAPVVNLPTPKGYSALGIATLELPATAVK
ncbi:MAG: beta-propeller fold lactonase family protein [Candidatus Sulfotelmatobacter sp.]|jgi:6-phosphogluconolactonase (cycloisomerase 2 family)